MIIMKILAPFSPTSSFAVLYDDRTHSETMDELLPEDCKLLSVSDEKTSQAQCPKILDKK